MKIENKKQAEEQGLRVKSYSNGDWKYTDCDGFDHLYRGCDELTKGIKAKLACSYDSGAWSYKDEDGDFRDVSANAQARVEGAIKFKAVIDYAYTREEGKHAVRIKVLADDELIISHDCPADGYSNTVTIVEECLSLEEFLEFLNSRSDEFQTDFTKMKLISDAPVNYEFNSVNYDEVISEVAKDARCSDEDIKYIQEYHAKDSLTSGQSYLIEWCGDGTLLVGENG